MLKIVDLRGNEVATIRRGPDGSLFLEVTDERFRPHLETFMERIQSEPLPLVGGGKEMRGQQVVRTTRRRLLRPDDPDFLDAVQDMVARSRLTLDDVRVRAFAVEENTNG
jgi:hypothetical protein